MRFSRKILKVAVVSLSLCNVPACAKPGVSAWAIGTLDEHYVGQYVGGGKHHGQARRQQEGTWGRDYVGWDLLRLNDLRWGHSSKRIQGGMGRY